MSINLQSMSDQNRIGYCHTVHSYWERYIAAAVMLLLMMTLGSIHTIFQMVAVLVMVAAVVVQSAIAMS